VKQGQIIVRAPDFVKKAVINAFIQEKSLWLQSKIIAQQQAQTHHFDFSHGSETFLLGKKAKLVVGYGNKNQVFSESSKDGSEQTCLVVIINERHRVKLAAVGALAKQVKKQLELYFKAQAQRYICTRLVTFSEQTLLIPKQVKIRLYRARWGSCNSRKEVSFNYLLMMTPLWVIDYVIVHELCHLRHLNHSTDFWKLVAKHYPRYQEAKKWLVNHQNALVWQLPY
jgi:predicted metal-dependent hydrolase